MDPTDRFDATDPIEKQALELIWQQACLGLRAAVGDAAFERWFLPLNLVRVTAAETCVLVPNSIYSIWVETNYKADLEKVIESFFKNHGQLKFEVKTPQRDQDFNSVKKIVTQESSEEEINYQEVDSNSTIDLGLGKPRRSGKKKAGKDASGDSLKKVQKHHECPDLDRLRKLGASAGLNEEHLLENFVVGDSNRMAVAAAEAVTKQPGKTYQPLFIHAGSGLGKTHLLHAIGWRTLLLRPNSKVVFLSAENFTNEYVKALQENALPKFRAKYRKVDLLLIDDVQFLSKKVGMQEEFFHTFNSLNDAHKQIVMTSDMPPHEIRQLENRLVTRFQWGLTTEIAAPSEETRAAILQRKRDEWELNVSNELIGFIANRVHNNVRLLEGALIRCSMAQNLNEHELTQSELEVVIADLQTHTDHQRHNPDSIQEVVAEEYGLNPRELTGRRRTARVAEARHVAMLFARELTDYSLVEIGEAFCRDHGTVIHGINSLRDKMEKSTSVRGTVEKIRRTLTRGNGGDASFGRDKFEKV